MNASEPSKSLSRRADPADASLIFAMVVELAEYEHLAGEVYATKDGLAAALFGPNPRVFCDIAERDGEAAGIAMWFYTF